MITKKIGGLTQVLCGLIISAIFLTSCSNLSQSGSSNSQTIDDEIPVTNITTQTLNQKLGNISDETSAVDAVNSFVEYVATRFEEPETDGVTTQSGSQESNVDLLKKYFDITQIAQMELNLRTKGITAQSGSEAGMLSAEELSGQINEQDTSGDQVNVKEIETIRDAIRMAMPNIAPDKNNLLMSQIEAHTVAWAYMTGDDGTMATNALKLGQPLPDLLSQARQNKEEITAQMGCIAGTILVLTILSGVDNAVAQTYGYDLFGNKVEVYEEKVFFVKVGRKKEKRTKNEVVAKYYRLSDLEDAAAEVSDYLTLNYGSNSNGLALIDNSNNDNISIASGKSGLSIQSNNFLDFPYSSWKNVIRKGDLIFKKSSRNDIVTDMSYLSHVAMFYQHESRDSAKVYESVSYGANIYNLGENWVDLNSRQPNNYLFSLRRIGNTSSSTIASAIDTSVTKHAGTTKFRPDILTPNGGTTQPENLRIDQKIAYFREWTDKNSTESAYCSKLVWLTFKGVKNNSGVYIDLDSNATRAKSNIKESWALMGSDKGVWNAFIGVSPDDIFDSSFLDTSFFYYKDSFLEITQGG